MHSFDLRLQTNIIASLQSTSQTILLHALSNHSYASKLLYIPVRPKIFLYGTKTTILNEYNYSKTVKAKFT